MYPKLHFPRHLKRVKKELKRVSNYVQDNLKNLRKNFNSKLKK